MRCAPLLLVTGCFYVQPINQRPSADIIQVSSAAVYRGEKDVELDASVYDPEGQLVELKWRVYACSDATQPSGCDDVPFHTDVLQAMHFAVPPYRADGTTPTVALRVILEASDADGATAKPSQELLIPVDDAAPTLMLSTNGRYGDVVNTPIDVFAKADDPDDGAANLAPLDWKLFSPPGSTATLGPTSVANAMVLVPDLAGDYDVQVTATDPLGVATVEHIGITAAPDTPPCLEQWAPLAGGTFPMQDPTLFQILVVKDDLDPYPAISNDPVLGTTTFTWSLLPPGATQRQLLTGVLGNSVALDPASYKPGDVLELRVEIADRNHTMVNCPDSDATCSVISNPACIQRQTWRVEVQ